MDHLSFLVYEFVTEDDLKTFYQEWKTGRWDRLGNHLSQTPNCSKFSENVEHLGEVEKAQISPVARVDKKMRAVE